MDKEEKRKKFHDSLLKMLYPPPSPPLPEEVHQTTLNISSEGFQHSPNTEYGNLSDDEEKLSSSSSDGEQQKLTRAQRKSLRKKKLRQAASQRRPIIGPLLPTTPTHNTLISDADRDLVLVEPQPVRHNAAQESASGIDNSEEQGVSSNQNKLKQRRMAKKLTRDIKEQKDSSHRGL